jgi:hypothetical protein
MTEEEYSGIYNIPDLEEYHRVPAGTWTPDTIKKLPIGRYESRSELYEAIKNTEHECLEKNLLDQVEILNGILKNVIPHWVNSKKL